MFRRRRFRDVIDRQLGFFEEDDSDLLDDVDRALARYDGAGRDEAEELYGDYLDAVETGTELLADMRDAYAQTLDESLVDRYLRDFDRAVGRRLPRFRLELENR